VNLESIYTQTSRHNSQSHYPIKKRRGENEEEEIKFVLPCVARSIYRLTEIAPSLSQRVAMVGSLVIIVMYSRGGVPS
jgi:hypothetical protein